MASSTPIAHPVGATNVHHYLHLAPEYAQPDQSTARQLETTSRIGTAPTSTLPGHKSDGNLKSRLGIKPWEEGELRGFVLEYLLSSCYSDSAKAFATEIAGREKEDTAAGQNCGELRNATAEVPNDMEGVEATPPPENRETIIEAEGPDFAENSSEDRLTGEDSVTGFLTAVQVQDAQRRQAIRESILSGRIAQAINLLNTHYPSVLKTPVSPTAPSSPSKLPPFHPQSPKQAHRCTPRNFFVLSETASSSTSASSAAPVPIVGSSFGSWAISLSPEILTLNLQLQSFVELMRTGHATSSISTPSTPTSSVRDVGSGGGATDDTGMTSSITSLASSTTSTSLLSSAITASQALLSSIQALPPSKDKESWERECVDVCGLLAYKDLTHCPVRGYLEPNRREGLAEMVNSAILQRTNRTPLPLLELAARSATAVWSTLAEMKVPVPPIPPTTTTTLGQNGTTKTKVTKTFPHFDFSRFANEDRAPPSPQTTENIAMQP